MTTVFWLLLILAAALPDWFSVATQNKALEYVFKPATLVLIIGYAWWLRRNPYDAFQARFFVAGLVLSLVGDVFLMLPGDFFIPGLVSFLLAHICYIVGLNRTAPPGTAFLLLLPVAALGVGLYLRIAAGLRASGDDALLLPVAVYSVALGLMLFSAWATLFRPDWYGVRRALVIIGGSLFFISDATLAWERFIHPSLLLKVLVIVTYHLGQVCLAASLGDGGA